MIMTSFTTFLFTLLSLFAIGLAAPIQLDARDVYVPPVTYPKAGTVWKIGDDHHVRWDTSNPPEQITNREGMILLAHDKLQDTKHPLAKGFDILKGSVKIKVPRVKPGKYALVLFGDSGNYSPTFTIEAA